MSVSPTLAEVINDALESRISDVHVALPAKIESYDEINQKASIKPLIKNVLVLSDGEVIDDLPIINDVPVVFPRGGGFFLTFPLAVGDFVLLIVCESSIEKFTMGTGVNQNPSDLRRHSLSDAVCFPGFYPFQQSIVDADPDNMAMGKDESGIQLRMTSDNKVEITFDNGSTLVVQGKDSGAQLTLGDGARRAALFEELKTAFDAHVHPTGVGPSGPPTVALPSNVGSTKVKFPAG